MYDCWPIFVGHSALFGPVSNQVTFMAGHLFGDRPPSKSPVGDSHSCWWGHKGPGFSPIMRWDLSRVDFWVMDDLV